MQVNSLTCTDATMATGSWEVALGGLSLISGFASAGTGAVAGAGCVLSDGVASLLLISKGAAPLVSVHKNVTYPIQLQV